LTSGDELDLDAVLDCYVRAAEAGEVPGKEDLLNRHPGLTLEIETLFETSPS
jgi:hypothetical protein